MKLFSLIIKLLLLAVFIVLAAFNTHIVSFSYLPGSEIRMPLILLLLAFFVIGAVFGVFSMFGRLLALRHENNRLRNELKKNARMVTAAPQAKLPDNAAPAPAGTAAKE